MAPRARLQKTSRFFLQHLLPRDLLSAEQRARLDRILAEDEPGAQRVLALELAEDLARRGRYRREAPGVYLDLRQGHRYRLEALDAGDGSARDGAPEAAAEADADAPAGAASGAPAETATGAASDAPAGRDAAPAAGAALALSSPALPAIDPALQVGSLLDALNLDGPALEAGNELARLVALIGTWHRGVRARLIRFDLDQAPDESEHALGVDPRELAPQHPYRAAVASEATLLLAPADSRLALLEGERPAEASLLLLPLKLGGETWGLLELALAPDVDPASLRLSLDLVQRALEHVLRNRRLLSRVVYVDWLTQVFNRGFLDQQLPLEIERATRNRENLALLMVDLDDFKPINDRLGHDVGDEVLRQFGMRLRRIMRRVDQVFRYGGEEFVVLLPRLDRIMALRAAQRLRQGIAAHPFLLSPDGEVLRLTISVGGAIYPQDALSATELFRAADQACYQAKRQGKNRVCFAGDAGAIR